MKIDKDKSLREIINSLDELDESHKDNMERLTYSLVHSNLIMAKCMDEILEEITNLVWIIDGSEDK